MRLGRPMGKAPFHQDDRRHRGSRSAPPHKPRTLSRPLEVALRQVALSPVDRRTAVVGNVRHLQLETCNHP